MSEYVKFKLINWDDICELHIFNSLFNIPFYRSLKIQISLICFLFYT